MSTNLTDMITDFFNSFQGKSVLGRLWLEISADKADLYFFDSTNDPKGNSKTKGTYSENLGSTD